MSWWNRILGRVDWGGKGSEIGVGDGSESCRRINGIRDGETEKTEMLREESSTESSLYYLSQRVSGILAEANICSLVNCNSISQ